MRYLSEEEHYNGRGLTFATIFMTKTEKGYCHLEQNEILVIINYRFLRSKPSLTFIVYQEVFFSLYNQSSLTFLNVWGYIDIHNHRGFGWFNDQKHFLFFSFLSCFVRWHYSETVSVEPVLNGTVFSDHPIFSGRFSKSRNFYPLVTIISFKAVIMSHL